MTTVHFVVVVAATGDDRRRCVYPISYRENVWRRNPNRASSRRVFMRIRSTAAHCLDGEEVTAFARSIWQREYGLNDPQQRNGDDDDRDHCTRSSARCVLFFLTVYAI